MVKRDEYLQSLKQWKDEQVIKVVTGIRRCGKSTLLTQYQEWLKTGGMESDRQKQACKYDGYCNHCGQMPQNCRKAAGT